MASTSKLSDAASASNAGAPAALPTDALFEVLLRLPAKDLCRLRAVCRSWRFLTYDPHFAAVHKSRHAEPLFAFTFRDGDGDDRGIAIVGLSGQVLRRIRFGSDCIHLNPATAAALTLPGLCSDEFVGICIERTFGLGFAAFTHNCRTVTYAFGQVASTGDYKVLRISHPDRSKPQLCDIITLDGSSQGMWRRKQNPPSGLTRMRKDTMECLAVNGVVYFVFDYAIMEPASLAPFNLDTEKWMPTLRGPKPLQSVKFDRFDRELSLANLNGSLVIVDSGDSSDLWFLMNRKRGLWVKKYRLSMIQLYYLRRPLLILDDGRIVIFDMVERLLQCYDPTTGDLADVLDVKAMGLSESQSIAVYTGSLLI